MLAYFKSFMSQEPTLKEKAFRLIERKIREKRLTDMESKSLQEFKLYHGILERTFTAFANQIDDYPSPLLYKLPKEVSHGILNQLTQGIKNFVEAYQNFCLFGQPEQTDVRNALKAYVFQMLAMHRSFTLTLLKITDFQDRQTKQRLIACLDETKNPGEIMLHNMENHSKISAWLSANKYEYSLVAKVNELIKTQDELLKNLEGNLIPRSPWEATSDPIQDSLALSTPRAK